MMSYSANMAVGLTFALSLCASFANAAEANAEASVQIRNTSNETVSANLIAITSDQIQYTQEGAPSTLARTELLDIRFQEPTRVVSPLGERVAVQLIDGSRFRCSTLLFGDKQVQCQLAGGRSLPFEISQLNTLQFGDLDESQLKTWQSIVESRASGDVLIVRQPTGALTRIEGLVAGINESTVSFEFSGQTIPVPFERLAGIKFFSKAEPPRPPVAAILFDRDQGSWICTQCISANDQYLTLELQCGSKFEFSVEQVEWIDFSAGSAVYLATIEPSQASSSSAFNFPKIPGAENMFGARAIRPVNLPGKFVGPSIEFLGAGEATYQLPDGFRNLEGTVVLRPKGQAFTPCTVSISSGETQVWSARLAQTRAPQTFKIPLPPGGKVTLSVTPESDLPVGDVVVWQAPRLLK